MSSPPWHWHYPRHERLLYRLHPIEWNLGEVAGALAADCLDNHRTPRQVRNTPRHLAEFQQLLTDLGVELVWPADIRLTRKYY